MRVWVIHREPKPQKSPGLDTGARPFKKKMFSAVVDSLFDPSFQVFRDPRQHDAPDAIQGLDGHREHSSTGALCKAE
jgi:hypothetical protein